MPFPLDDPVSNVTAGSPRAIRAVLGCPIAGFHMSRDGCRKHDVNRDAVMQALSVYARMLGLF